MFWSFIVVSSYENRNLGFDDLFRPRENQLLIACEQNLLLQSTMCDHHRVVDSGICLSEFLVDRNKLKIKASRAQYLRQLVSPEAPIEKEDWRFFRLRLSIRNLQSLL